MASRNAVTVALAGSVLGAATAVLLAEQPVSVRAATPQPVRRQTAHREYIRF
jgi:membrane protein YqaA with SNARE-associated domain